MPSAIRFCPLIASRKRLSHQAGRVAAVIGLVVILTAITASLSLRLAEQYGRLSIPPTYDDVAYFLAAAQWLKEAPSQGLAANFYGLLHQHAPFSTLTAAIGFTLRPNSFLGPYAINAVIILAFLLGLAGLLWRRSLVDIVTSLVGAEPAMGSRTGIGQQLFPRPLCALDWRQVCSWRANAWSPALRRFAQL